ncbi:Zn-dependent exopeptidase [Neoconidiobolus thromboides FSU 785]|nr:Zn-dependent exopeptidase [Neoconidiobolus thromboides FSU 785]
MIYFYILISVFIQCSISISSSFFRQTSIKNSRNFYHKLSESSKQQAVDKLSQYIQFNTAEPNPNYNSTVAYLQNYAKELNLTFNLFKCSPSNYPSVLLTLLGKNSSLPSILLNSHMDVVPAVENEWHFPAFNKTIVKGKNGKVKIYGRGATDNKGLGVIHLESIRQLKNLYPNGFLRDVHVLIVSDEESGGKRGMGCILNSTFWKENVGEVALALGEGLTTNDTRVWGFYTERVRRGFKAIARGNTGHGSKFITHLALDKMDQFKLRMKHYRTIEENKMILQNFTLGEVTTSNLNILQSGKTFNVVPDKVIAYFDVRATPIEDLVKLKKDIQTWGKESEVEIEFLFNDKVYQSEYKGNPFWSILEKKAKEINKPITMTIFPGSSDLRYLREKGLFSIGLTPINFQQDTAHGNDEFLNSNSVIGGIEFFVYVLPELFNLVE